METVLRGVAQMGDNFNYNKYKDKVKSLTERAKKNDAYKNDIDIGELFYIEMLKKYIMEFRSGSIDTSALESKQKTLETALLKYYQWGEVFDFHVEVRNRYSHVMTMAEKCGCPICKKILKIFDGRE